MSRPSLAHWVSLKIFAISGSLRTASINSAPLRTTANLAPPHIEITVCGLVGELPLFNPDLEALQPDAVRRLYQQVGQADALLIASPEYAHGVTGAIRNTLDWLMGCEAFVSKPVAVLNASPRARLADAALGETLKTMSAVIVEPASLTIPLLGANLGQSDMAQTPAIAHALRESLAALYGAVVLQRAEGGPVFPV